MPKSNCDICGRPLGETYVDGKTRMGPWADMCESCFEQHGVGLGTGKGQRHGTFQICLACRMHHPIPAEYLLKKDTKIEKWQCPSCGWATTSTTQQQNHQAYHQLMEAGLHSTNRRTDVPDTKSQKLIRKTAADILESTLKNNYGAANVRRDQDRMLLVKIPQPNAGPIYIQVKITLPT